MAAFSAIDPMALRNARRSYVDMDMLTNSRRVTAAAGDRVIVLANRAPFKREQSHGHIVSTRSASGLVTALEPLLDAYAGTWVAHAAGDADLFAVDTPGGIDVPPANPRYRVRYVAIPAEEFRGYYYGFANEGLWPLCHRVGVTPVFRRADYEMYRAANTRFANVVAEEARCHSPIVLVQDYHFALAPSVIRERLPASRVAAFWHIPWPHCRAFLACPWDVELLEGLLGSDIVGFQTNEDCQNFLSSVDAALPKAVVDRQQATIEYRGRLTMVHHYPVGVDCAHEALRSAPSIAECREWVCRQLALPATIRIGVGVDRMDYTKGLNEKFLAIEHLLETKPELAGTFAFVQIAEPSRECLAAYRDARDQAFATCQRVNRRFATESVKPIHLLEKHHEPADVYRYYRAADFCYVGSLHDGMNLVAKEFVAARDDERGVLILSQFAGAAKQLRAALLVNPFRTEQSADALIQAVEMSSVEQAKRMRILRAEVTSFDALWWATRIVQDVAHTAEIDRGANKAACSTAVA
jgi:trehalose-6-phosphate synthase